MTFRGTFDRSNIESKKTSTIILVLIVMWLAVFTVVFNFIKVVNVILAIFAVAAVITIVLIVWFMSLTQKKYTVTADDTSVKVISNNRIMMDLKYADIAKVDYSFKEEYSYRYARAYRQRYVISARIDLKNGKSLDFTKDLGSSHESHYSSVEEMAASIGSKAVETELLVYVQSRLTN